MGEEKKKSEIAESVSQNRLRPEHGSRSKDLLDGGGKEEE